MAGNPEWNQDLDTWKAYFSKWMRDSNPKDVLDVAIFFDFRCIYGDAALIDDLRSHIHQSSEGKSVFFFHMAQSVVKMKVLANLPGNLKAESQADTRLDMKKILLPVTSFIRLYAIREKLVSTNSMERALKLHKRSVLNASTLQELSEPFDFITYLRIKTQAFSMARNELPENTIRLGQLTQIEALTLKKLFSDITGLQTRLGTEFSGVE
jgi:CBS domain-containing protein